MKLEGSKRQLEKILEDETKILVTAQIWVIFDMLSNRPLKDTNEKSNMMLPV